MADESTPSQQDKRKRQILAAVLRLLRVHGTGITTAQIAAEANCSKETLYSWFGDRDGIFMALATEQANGMGDALAVGFASAEGDFSKRLKAFSTLLLDILTGEALLAVHRVAMAQVCSKRSELGQRVLADWNGQVMKPFLDLFQQGNKSGAVVVHSGEEAFEALCGLLVGDKQRRLLLGENTRPSASSMAAVANKAVQRWMILYGA